MAFNLRANLNFYSSGISLKGLDPIAWRTVRRGSDQDDDLNSDQYSTGSANEIYYTYNGADSVHAGGGSDKVYGGTGRDTFHGEDGNDYLYGYGGDDVLYGGDGRDRLYGGDDSDYLFGGDGNDYLYGGSGRDFLRGGTGNDKLYGGSQNDEIRGGAGQDVINGGSGNDRSSYQNSNAGVNVNLQTGRGSGGDAQGDTLISIESIYGSRHNDVITGDNNSNILKGLFGDDVINGGGGNDRINGGEGNDILDGGSGIDTISYYADSSTFGRAAMDIDLQEQYAEALDIDPDNDQWGDYQYDVIRNFENAIGSYYDDEIYGSSSNNRLDGRDGDDELYGRQGSDTLVGGKGSDTFFFDHDDNGNSDSHTEHDVIEDFNVDGNDRIDLDDTEIGSWHDLRNMSDGDGMFQDGNDVVIHTTDFDTVRLENVRIHDLDQNDFIF